MWIIRTALLMGLLTGLLLGIGYFVGGSGGAFVALLFSFIMNFFTYWFSDKIVLGMYGAKELPASENPKLHTILSDLSRKAGIPKPALYLVGSMSSNAFATGRSPSHASIAVTKGLLENMDMGEIEGVLAHEMAHIKHRDTLLSVMAATIAGAISYIAHMLQFAVMFGGRERRGNAAGSLFLMILAPFIAMLIQLAISRSREFSADSYGARIASPFKLAGALRKLGYLAQRTPMRVDPATSHLFIVNPFRGGGLARLFMTHPPLEERISRLEKMVGGKL